MNGGRRLRKPGRRLQKNGRRLRKGGPRRRLTSEGLLWLARLCLVVFILAGWQLKGYLEEDRRQQAVMEDLRDRAVEPAPPQADEELERPPIQVDFAALQSENPDIVAWLYCPDTQVNYPVLYSGDNRYYLRRLSDGSKNIAGSIFADEHNTPELGEENLIVYGHNMSNGSMFALLPGYAQQEFYEAHPVWYLLTPAANYRVELFAGFVTSTRSLVYYPWRMKTDDGRYITEKAWEDSDFRGAEPPAEGERTLTLSTCSYRFSGARYVLMGVLREISPPGG